jgi:hypothetical protein
MEVYVQKDGSTNWMERTTVRKTEVFEVPFFTAATSYKNQT